MQLKLVSKGAVEISENGASAVVIFPGAKVPESAPLVIGPQVEDKVVHRPGEYEFASVGLIAIETKAEHNGTAEFFVVEINGQNALFIMNGFGTLTKEDWDMMNDIDVIVVSLKEKQEGLDKLINRLIPYVVIAIEAESEVEAENALGLKPISTADKFKFIDKDFEAEDPATILYLMK